MISATGGSAWSQNPLPSALQRVSRSTAGQSGSEGQHGDFDGWHIVDPGRKGKDLAFHPSSIVKFINATCSK